MNPMSVKAGTNLYKVHFANQGNTSAYACIGAWLDQHPGCSQVVVITDEQVQKCLKAELESLLTWMQKAREGISVRTIVLKAGEESKSVQSANAIWRELSMSKFKRSDLVIAFGGGVVGDVAGFCAATYMRGVAYVQIPTSLLAQIDSSVGGKTAINLDEGKNLVGQFYTPEMVLINAAYLQTLEDAYFLDGLGELLKYGLLADEKLLALLEDKADLTDLRWFLEQDRDLLESVVRRCLHIKRALVEVDFDEVCERKYLNLGHSLGHAFEAYFQYEMSHGKCVALGCWWAYRISWMRAKRIGSVAAVKSLEVQLRRLEAILRKYDFPMEVSFDLASVIAYLALDKKANAGGVQFVLPKSAESDLMSNNGLNDRKVRSGMGDRDEDLAILNCIRNRFEFVTIPIDEVREIMTEMMMER